MRNLIDIKLFALLVIILMGGSIAEAYDFEEGGIFYTVNNDGATLTVARNTESPYGGDVVIPNEVTHGGTTYSVTAIEDLAFIQCENLTGLIIGDSVANIGRMAFAGCTNLTNLTVGLSVPTLCYKKSGRIYFSLSGCDNITTLTWKARNCPDLGGMNTANFQHVILGDQVEVIPISFAEGSQITEITIPNSVTSIGNSAFAGCSGLTGTLTIPNSVTSIGNSAFAGCSGLIGTLTIPNSVTSIGNSAFAGCSGLAETLTIPNSVTSVGLSAFSGCSGLTTLSISNSVTTISANAFRDCIGLTEVIMGSAVAEIGFDAFKGCDNLTKVRISSIEAWCRILFDSGYYNDDYTIGNSNPLLYAHRLYLNDQEVKDLVIPNTITAINDYAFQGCSSLTSVTVPNSVTTIGDLAFTQCTGLENVTLGSSVTDIGVDAFYGCIALTGLTISKSVTSIKSNILIYCPNLTRLSVESGNPVYDSREDCNAIIETATNTLLIGCQNTVIPNTVTNIAGEAFIGCEKLSSIIIPSSVTSIGKVWSIYDNDTSYYYYNPFIGCNGLKSITVESGNPVYDSREGCNAIIETATNTLLIGCQKTVIPNVVTAIYEWAFCQCTGLTSVTIPNSVSTIGSSAFYGCTGLTGVNIPESVTTIGNSAFYDCTGLTSIDIPNSVTTIGNYAFQGCTGVTSLNLGDSLSRIGHGAFQDCTSLTSVVIPNSVISNDLSDLTFGWFWGCTALESVTIGSGIGIMAAMFWECPNITSVTCLATTPPNCITAQYTPTKTRLYNFDDVVLEQATLYVPLWSLDAYQIAQYWKSFMNIQPISTTILGDVNGDKEVSIADVNALIDMILQGGAEANGDVNQDLEVTIADINAVIDIILNN